MGTPTIAEMARPPSSNVCSARHAVSTLEDLSTVRQLRFLGALLAALLVVGGAFFLGLQLIGRSPQEAGQIVGVVAGGLTVLGILGKTLAWLWRSTRPPDVGRASVEQIDNLAAAVRGQWQDEAARRKLLSPAPLPIRWRLATPDLRGPIGGAVDSRERPGRFSVLPNFQGVTEQMLRSGGGLAELLNVFGGLLSGRLVLTGPPGAGKTGTGVILLLEVLKYRAELPAEDQAQVPVPVMFTLADWDPSRTPFDARLAHKLAETYFTGRAGAEMAAALVNDGHVAAIVDGLDEIDADLRPTALEAMSASRLRLVLLTRTDEMATAARAHRLVDAAVLELCDIDAASAADYLDRSLPGQPPAHWDDLLTRLRSESDDQLAASLRTPLTLTLMRDSYKAGDDVRDLLDASRTSTAKTIEDHLLDRIIEVAYTPRAGQPAPAYNAQVAQRTLSFLADRMTHDGTRDLAWWHLPRWAPRIRRGVGTGLLVGFATALVAGLVVGLWFGFVDGRAVGLEAGLVFGLLAGLGFGLATGYAAVQTRGHGKRETWWSWRRPPDEPRRVGRPRWRSLVSPKVLVQGLASGLMAVPLYALVAAVFEAPALAVGLVAGLAIGVGTALVRGLQLGIERPGIDLATPVTPATAWRNDWRAGLVVSLVPVLVLLVTVAASAALMLWFGLWDVSWHELGYGLGAFGGLLLLLALVVGLMWPVTYITRLAFVQLAISHRLPVRLMRFLEDARDREILRAVGAVYQFRHARLQDRLSANAAVATPKQPTPTSQT
jgi:hypothetical protein